MQVPSPNKLVSVPRKIPAPTIHCLSLVFWPKILPTNTTATQSHDFIWSAHKKLSTMTGNLLNFTFFYNYWSLTISTSIYVARSNLVLTAPTVNEKRILRNRYLLFCTAYNHENPDCTSSIEKEPIQTLDHAYHLLDRKVSSSSHTLQA